MNKSNHYFTIINWFINDNINHRQSTVASVGDCQVHLPLRPVMEIKWKLLACNWEHKRRLEGCCVVMECLFPVCYTNIANICIYVNIKSYYIYIYYLLHVAGCWLVLFVAWNVLFCVFCVCLCSLVFICPFLSSFLLQLRTANHGKENNINNAVGNKHKYHNLNKKTATSNKLEPETLSVQHALGTSSRHWMLSSVEHPFMIPSTGHQTKHAGRFKSLWLIPASYSLQQADKLQSHRWSFHQQKAGMTCCQLTSDAYFQTW